MSKHIGDLKPKFKDLISVTNIQPNNISEGIPEDMIEIGPDGKITTGIKDAQRVEYGTKSTNTSEVLHNYYTINNNIYGGSIIMVTCEYIDFNQFLKGDTLNCSGHRISIEQLTAFLFQHQEVHKLILSNCGLEINKICKLSEHSKALVSITDLDLSSNYFTNRSLLRAFDFKNLPNLKSLNLSDANVDLNDIRLYGIKLLQQLEELNISNNIINIFDINKLPDYLPSPENLTKFKLLCLSDNNILIARDNKQIDLNDVEKDLKTFGYDFHLFNHTIEHEVSGNTTTSDWDLV